MKMTLLELTQDILNDMDADEVNSIDDTPEAAQVAQIVKTTYFAMMSSRNWPHLRKRVQLNSPGLTQCPTHLKVPSETKEMVMISYDCRREQNGDPEYKELKYLTPDAFLRKQNQLKLSNPDVISVMDGTGVEFFVNDNRAPVYYTSFNDSEIVCDAYNKDIEDTLHPHKTQAIAFTMPDWNHIDDFVPELPEEAFISLVEQAKAKASAKLKQWTDREAKEEAVRQRRWLSRKDWQVAGGLNYPNYGRRR